MIGTLIADRYQVVRRLGAGATGEVFLVDNTANQRREAIKILTGDHANRAVAGRWKREVRATQRLSHQNIVAIYDFGRLPDGRMFLTMEAVDGTPLDGLIRQRGPLHIPVALGIVAEVADALHHAHAHDVIHRDIKPHNLILATHPAGSIVKVLDFGLAKIIAPDTKDSVVLSKHGAAFGTPAYMSPEQWKTLPPDARTDIYALGCVAFGFLVGEPPYRGTAIELVAAHLTKQPRVPSRVDPSAGIPAVLDQIVLRCLAKDPRDRFQTGGDLCAALQHVPDYRPLRVHTH